MAVSEKTVSVNRRALHDYDVLDRLDAGIVLTGSEIKSIRDGRVSIREAYARPEGGELWLIGAHIAHYPAAARNNHEPGRPRKLLVHKSELADLSRALTSGGLTLVPLRLYLKRGLAKVELGLVRGRKKYDKREAIARREAERQVARALRRRG